MSIGKTTFSSLEMENVFDINWQPDLFFKKQTRKWSLVRCFEEDIVLCLDGDV